MEIFRINENFGRLKTALLLATLMTLAACGRGDNLTNSNTDALGDDSSIGLIVPEYSITPESHSGDGDGDDPPKPKVAPTLEDGLPLDDDGKIFVTPVQEERLDESELIHSTKLSVGGVEFVISSEFHISDNDLIISKVQNGNFIEQESVDCIEEQSLNNGIFIDFYLGETVDGFIVTCRLPMERIGENLYGIAVNADMIGFESQIKTNFSKYEILLEGIGPNFLFLILQSEGILLPDSENTESQDVYPAPMFPPNEGLDGSYPGEEKPYPSPDDYSPAPNAGSGAPIIGQGLGLSLLG